MRTGAHCSAALDLAGTRAGFAVIADGEILADSARPMRGREAAGLAEWVGEELKRLGLGLREIDRWTVGAGPGSFTGMRLAASLAAGWSYGRPEVRTRCVPTAVALAAALPGGEEGETAGCVFDGRNRELIYFQLIREDGQWRPSGAHGVYDAAGAARFFAGNADRRLIAYAEEMTALSKLLQDVVVQRISFVDTPCFSALAAAEWRKFDGNLADLVYIRPAVFTTPVTG